MYRLADDRRLSRYVSGQAWTALDGIWQRIGRPKQSRQTERGARRSRNITPRLGLRALPRGGRLS